MRDQAYAITKHRRWVESNLSWSTSHGSVGRERARGLNAEMLSPENVGC